MTCNRACCKPLFGCGLLAQRDRPVEVEFAAGDEFLADEAALLAGRACRCRFRCRRSRFRDLAPGRLAPSCRARPEPCASASRITG